jgi:hypothetical protein
MQPGAGAGERREAETVQGIHVENVFGIEGKVT